MKTEEEKLFGYTKAEWITMIKDKVVTGISDDVFQFIRPDMSDEEILLYREKQRPPLPNPNAFPVSPKQAIAPPPPPPTMQAPLPPSPTAVGAMPAPPAPPISEQIAEPIKPMPMPPNPTKPVDVGEMANHSKELEIFSIEQLNVLPEDARLSIVNLGENLPSKELMILNPLVSKLLQIKELTKIKYVPLPEEPTKEDLQAHKANIEEFKLAKKAITDLKSQNTSAKSAIKGPLDLLGKNVLTIEKSVKKIAEEVLEEIEKTFKPYIDAEAEKAKLKKDRIEEKSKEAINELSQQNVEQANQFKKSTLITYLKYEMLDPLKNTVNEAIQNYSLEKIYLVRDGLSLRVFKTDALAENKDLNLLTEEEINSMDTNYRKEIDVLRTNLNTKIKALELEKSNETMQNALEEVNNVPSAPAPPPLSNFPNSIGNVPPLVPPAPESVPAASENLNTPIGYYTLEGPTGAEDLNQASSNFPLPPAPENEAQKIDAFAVSNQNSATPYGSGANAKQVPIELYPDNSNAVDYLDLIIAEIEKTRANVSYITNRFLADTNIVKTDEDVKNVGKVQASDDLMNKVIQYILGTLPPKQ